jgi:hypothetical protein
MIGQISVNDADSRTGCVSAGNNGVNGAAEPMCSSSRLNSKSERLDQVIELSHLWIVRTVEPDVEITNDIDLNLVGGNVLKI